LKSEKRTARILENWHENRLIGNKSIVK